MHAARLATTTPFSESTLYALARELETDDIDLDEDYLAEANAADLVERVESAVNHGMVHSIAADDIKTAHNQFITARKVANRKEVRIKSAGPHCPRATGVWLYDTDRVRR
ncbi:hypothetical protein [Haladaptatus sp. YSMS36]|uniref:hypothetical protein n=1 Tax=Haladaptatus sp. YSMS36 TaxID=3033384 RepID=UPI0023E843DF|nr:hypothetical protein [Haladaptatus sp. YSMS36]